MGPLRDHSDAELLAAFRSSRSAVAFAALMARHTPWLLCLCRRRLARHQDAEDAVQAVFIALFRHPERVHYSLGGWLYRAAYRAVKDLQRAAARRARREAMTRARHPASFRDKSELHEEIAIALGRLPTRLRQAVALRYLEGLNQREAALRLGCPQGTIATRARAGLLRLRELVGC
jgi:RNA polymerase sigma factor (sigma-70 family)